MSSKNNELSEVMAGVAVGLVTMLSIFAKVSLVILSVFVSLLAMMAKGNSVR